MSRLTGLFVSLTLTFAGVSLAKAPEPEGKLLASIEIVEGFEPVRKRTGWWFYFDESPGLTGPSVTGVEYRNGKIFQVFGGGSEPELFDAVYRSGIEWFDFAEEQDLVYERIAKEAEARGEEGVVVGGVRDGARSIVSLVTDKGVVRFDAWKIGVMSDILAPKSEKMARLKKVLDQLRQFYTTSLLQF